MKKILLIVWLLVGLTWPGCGLRAQVSETRYDYSGPARQITQGCRTKLEQAEAIYRWLCRNIAYDTDYAIHTADSCWVARMGVCQAYSELFYRLGEPLGLESILVSGLSKDSDGRVSPEGHAWILAHVDNGWVLIDPTWGAGSVNGGNFVRSDNDMSWFWVDPSWMIFTHFPTDERYQLLDPPVDRAAFDALPPLRPVLAEYGFDGDKLLADCLAGRVKQTPELFGGYGDKIRIVEIPMQAELRPGCFHTFRVQRAAGTQVALTQGSTFFGEEQWEWTGDGLGIRFMPRGGGELHLSVRIGENRWGVVASYRIPEPTAAEWQQIEQHYPFDMPEMQRVENLNPDLLQQIGVDGPDLLRRVRRGEVSSLPVFFGSGDPGYTVDRIPLTRTLKAGKPYTFAIRPGGSGRWALIDQGETQTDWFRDWTSDPETGLLTQTVTPTCPGKLYLSVQTAEGGTFSARLEYLVE